MPFKDPKKNKEYMQEYGRKARKNMPSIIKALQLELSEEKLDEYYQEYKHKIREVRTSTSTSSGQIPHPDATICDKCNKPKDHICEDIFMCIEHDFYNKYNTTHISYKDGVLVKNEQPFKN